MSEEEHPTESTAEWLTHLERLESYLKRAIEMVFQEGVDTQYRTLELAHILRTGLKEIRDLQPFPDNPDDN